jgi:rubrerythrin
LSERDLEAVDTDASRRRFLQLAAPVAAGGLAAFLAACGTSSDPQTADENSTKARPPVGGHDLEIVNYALTLEYVEADFYDKVVSAGLFKGADGDVFKLIQQNEHEHVAALTSLSKRLGGPVPEKPATRFPIGGGARAALGVAVTLENTGAAAYLGQLDAIANKGVEQAVLSIHTVEARHAAKLARLAGDDFSPDGPFASPLSIDEVMNAIQPFLA